MALLDQVLGGVLGGGMGRGRGGGAMTSPVVKALLLALAAKAAQHHMAQRRAGPQDANHGGGLGGLEGSLGGLLGGGGAGRLGGMLGGLAGAGGLGAILDQFQRNGHGAAAQSWVGTGQNQRLEPHALAEALGPEAVDELEQETGVPRQQLLSQLADELPDAVDQLTPQGRMPTEEELTRVVN